MAEKGERMSRSSRRRFFTSFLTGALAVGLAACAGQFLTIVLRFLYPRKKKGNWLFVQALGDFPHGVSFSYLTPTGQAVLISRTGTSGLVDDFIALSNVCPHLGCKVHWEGRSKSFFCPCHNGRFDHVGRPLEGPPAKANQSLIRFPLKVEKGLLYIRVSSESLSRLSQLDQRHRHQHRHQNQECLGKAVT